MVSKQRSIEILSVLITSVVLAYIGVVSGIQLIAIDTPPQKGITVKVTGYQFYWTFQYPNGTSIQFPNGTTRQYPNGITLQNVFYVKVGQVVNLEVVSGDVAHSLFIPELGVHIDAIPGHVNTFWLSADSPGTYRIECTQFCGTGHYSMIGQLIAVP
jgi:heme/copper-type cytochrome/quinol oxidase subunit 2